MCDFTVPNGRPFCGLVSEVGVLWRIEVVWRVAVVQKADVVDG